MSEALAALRNGAHLVLSVSGGKDSDAMCRYLLALRKVEKWQGSVALVHADLGRAEWSITPAYVESLSRDLCVPLHVVRWTHGDLIDRIWQRYHKDPSRPCWPSSAARYCTSDLKRGPISRWIRNQYPEGFVVCAMGLRAEESSARAKKPVWERREDCWSAQKKRYVFNWLPIHHWTEAQVWQEIGHSLKQVAQWQEGVRYWQAAGKPMARILEDIQLGFHAHPAYALGNQRLSCALCVLGSVNDLLNGALHNPETYIELCRIEAETGYSFRKGFWITDLHPELLPTEIVEAVRIHQYYS